MLKTLKRIVQEVSAATDLSQALTILTNHVVTALSADASSVFLLDREKNEYVLEASVGLNLNVVGRIRVPFGEGLIGLVGEREKPINIDNAPAHPRFLRYKQFSEEAYSAFLGVPIISQGDPLGVLIVQQKTERFFAEDEEAFLVTLSAPK